MQIVTYAVEKNREQRRIKVSFAWCEDWSYCGWQKGMSQDEAMLKSEETKPIALAAIELGLSEGISQMVSQIVSQSDSWSVR